jgi:hypothetical protein
MSFRLLSKCLFQGAVYALLHKVPAAWAGIPLSLSHLSPTQRILSSLLDLARTSETAKKIFVEAFDKLI